MTRSRGPRKDSGKDSGKGTGGEPAKTGKTRKSLLSEDDEFVWGYTIRSLAPLQHGKARVHPSLKDDEDDAPVVFAPRGTIPHRKRASPSEPAQPDGAASARPGKTPDLQPFDAKRARKLRAGRIEIDARLDLHGLKQTEAHSALRRFLLACHRDGRRTVLVITGKGGGQDAARGDERHWSHGHERGVLKRNVPHWLAEPDLRRIIVSFATASLRHGGEGALYIHLRSTTKLADR